MSLSTAPPVWRIKEYNANIVQISGLANLRLNSDCLGLIGRTWAK
jgi:hypothetical protein